MGAAVRTAPAAAPGDRRRVLSIAVALAIATAALYGWRLDYSPIHLHYDEIFFGLQGDSIRRTGRDLNGLFLPIYFQLESTMNWYQPVGVYWTAAVLSVLPLSDAAIRWPTVLAGVANVVLMFVLARAVFNRLWWALLAAGLLMLTPAHFIHSRVAMDYVYPLPFLLGWTIGMVSYLRRPSSRTVFISGSMLGLAFFSYIAGTALAPIYVVATLVVLWWHGDVRRMPIAIAGFAWPVIAAALFVALHPDVVPQLLGKYGLYNANAAGTGLDPLQKLRETITASAVSDALNRYWRFFSPGYLFVTGGSNLTNSTRMAGVFLPPLALLMAAGAIVAIPRWRIIGGLVLFGFLTAPIPAAMLPEEFTIDRELAVVPFAILLAVMGAEWAWRLPATRTPSVLARATAVLIALVAIGYGAVTVLGRGAISSSTPILLIAAIGLYVIGIALERRRDWSPVVATLLVLAPLLFVPFLRDYFDEYRMRSSGWFGGNIRGAIEEVIRRADATQAPEIHLSIDIPYIRSYWRFYLLVHDRGDLHAKTKTFERLTRDTWAFAPGSILLAPATDPEVAALEQQGQLARETAVADAADSPLEQQFVILRR